MPTSVTEARCLLWVGCGLFVRLETDLSYSGSFLWPCLGKVLVACLGEVLVALFEVMKLVLVVVIQVILAGVMKFVMKTVVTMVYRWESWCTIAITRCWWQWSWKCSWRQSRFQSWWGGETWRRGCFSRLPRWYGGTRPEIWWLWS